VNAWPWIALVALGAWHGLNPGMGWLFAVSLGLQNRSRAAIFQAMCAIAIGHALSVFVIISLAFLLGRYISATWFGLAAALSLAGLGSWRLLRGRHPRWVGMRVNFRDLTWWSCLMASAHGAGLMLLPVFMIRGGAWCGVSSSSPLKPAVQFQGFYNSIPGVCVHALSQFVVAGIVAWLVYDIVGLAILRKSWFNADLVWSWSLILAGVLMLMVRV
jgi:ABC-type multidrug transport system fused ATPase/permease subunit